MSDTQFELSQSAITTGSKSFRLASLILDLRSKRGAYLLYRWCRFCDDQIDDAISPLAAKQELHELQANSAQALAGHFFEGTSPYSALFELHQSYGIPLNHFQDLLKGFAWDVSHNSIQNTDELLEYCYNVAGVVGVMMTPILTQNVNEHSLHYADCLGRGMQLTNIARDLREDWERGRTYLPQQWIQEKKMISLNFESPDLAPIIFELNCRLLKMADQFYNEGRKGLVYLPWRCAWSISIASFLYQGIGKKIIRKGSTHLKFRTILSPLEKGLAIIAGTFFFIFQRIRISFQKPEVNPISLSIQDIANGFNLRS